MVKGRRGGTPILLTRFREDTREDQEVKESERRDLNRAHEHENRPPWWGQASGSGGGGGAPQSTEAALAQAIGKNPDFPREEWKDRYLPGNSIGAATGRGGKIFCQWDSRAECWIPVLVNGRFIMFSPDGTEGSLRYIDADLDAVAVADAFTKGEE